jgi:hypothetical protein
MGDVIGDLNNRRGQIQGTGRGNAQVVEAMVPLANMFGYVSRLRSFTQGRAQYSMQFSHYEEVPSNVAEEVKAKMACLVWPCGGPRTAGPRQARTCTARQDLLRAAPDSAGSSTTDQPKHRTRRFNIMASS